MIPVILSSSTSPDVEALSENCGADAHMAQPFDIYDFCELITQTSFLVYGFSISAWKWNSA